MALDKKHVVKRTEIASLPSNNTSLCYFPTNSK